MAAPAHTPKTINRRQTSSARVMFSFLIHWTADQRHMDSKQMSLEWLPHETHVWGEQRKEEAQRTTSLDLPMKSCIIEATTILIFVILLKPKKNIVLNILKVIYTINILFSSGFSFLLTSLISLTLD